MTENSGSGNRWEPVGAPPPETPESAAVTQGPEEPSPRHTRRDKAVAAASADDQPGRQQQLQPPDGRDHDHDRGGFDDGAPRSQDET